LILWLGLAVALLALGVVLVPRILLQRAQDRLAREKLARSGSEWKLLTRAELVVSRYRRLPGLLGWNEEGIEFEGLFGERMPIAASRIQKIVTGRRLANGRILFRLQALRVATVSGEEHEFVLSSAAASAWRSHLGLWAAHERRADADRVQPGRG
jgi:hypothetical protein